MNAGTTDDPVAGRATSDDAVLDLLRAWVPDQRWFPAKGAAGRLARRAVLDLADPGGEAEVTVHLLALPSGGLLQVPVVLRPGDGTERTGTIARLADGRVLVDGCHDPAFLRAWLAAAERDVPSGAGPAALAGARVLTGEQSNTSVVLPATRPPAILKVFRGVGAGPNPDVDVPLALTRVGWHGVPRPLAWLTGSWPDAEGTGRPEVGHLGVLCELVAGAEDGFELACRHAAADLDFGELAEDLGRTTAQMHRALRTALPVEDAASGTPGTPGTAAHVAGVLRDRAASACRAAPVLAERAASIEAVISAVEQVTALPPLQRVHGDLHLGQVLRSPDRGWSVLDFEGEPQAPAAERTRPDLALRDLAGMLRSIDYAAAVGQARSAEWAAGARRRLVAGYRAEAPASETSSAVLLRALELDKALYEVVYEVRNRPGWVSIPLDGVDRLLAPRT